MIWGWTIWARNTWRNCCWNLLPLSKWHNGAMQSKWLKNYWEYIHTCQMVAMKLSNDSHIHPCIHHWLREPKEQCTRRGSIKTWSRHKWQCYCMQEFKKEWKIQGEYVEVKMSREGQSSSGWWWQTVKSLLIFRWLLGQKLLLCHMETTTHTWLLAQWWRLPSNATRNAVALKMTKWSRSKTQIANRICTFTHIFVFWRGEMCKFTQICVNLHKSWSTRGPRRPCFANRKSHLHKSFFT